MKPAAGLQLIGQILSLPHNPGAAERLRASLHRDSVVWEEIASLASRHLITPALDSALKTSGLAAELPADFVDYLAAVHDLNADRNKLIRDELARIVSILNSIGIEPVLLKGVANLVDGLYPSEGDRALADIDLLMPEEKLRPAFAALLGAGYQTVYPPTMRKQFLGKLDHHSAPVWRPEVGIPVELHRWLHHGSVPQSTPATETVKAAAVPFDAHLLTPVQRIVDCILHSQLQHGYYREASPCVRALWDCSLLGRALTAGDLASIESRFRSLGLTRFYADFVEWGTLLFPDFPLRSTAPSPRLHRLRKTLCLELPGYALAEEIVLRPVAKISGLLRSIQNGDLTWGELPLHILRRLGSREWWMRTYDLCLKRRRSLGL